MRVPLMRGFPRRISGSLTMYCFHATGMRRYYRLLPPMAKAGYRIALGSGSSRARAVRILKQRKWRVASDEKMGRKRRGWAWGCGENGQMIFFFTKGFIGLCDLFF